MSSPCSHAAAWVAARGGPAVAYLPIQRCLMEGWREAAAASAATEGSGGDVARAGIDDDEVRLLMTAKKKKETTMSFPRQTGRSLSSFRFRLRA